MKLVQSVSKLRAFAYVRNPRAGLAIIRLAPSNGGFPWTTRNLNCPRKWNRFWRPSSTGPDPDRTTAFVAQILGEHNFNPNEPRNRKGEWTTDGPGDGRTGVDYSSRSHRAGPSRGGIAYQDGRVVGSGDSRPYYPSPREREAIQKYDKTITVFVGHSADVSKAAKAAAVEINNTRGVRSAKIAGIGCGGGASVFSSSAAAK